MTDQDELRDRIMEPIWQNTMLTTEGAKRVAQAIIDEFGLTVEERNNGETSENTDGMEATYAIESRVVGKWED